MSMQSILLNTINIDAFIYPIKPKSHNQTYQMGSHQQKEILQGYNKQHSEKTINNMALNTIKNCKKLTKLYIMDSNNTPPATHKNSALRGVFCFWGNQHD